MATASKYLFLLFLSLLTVCSSGTLVGFSFNARGNGAASSLSRTVSFLKVNNVSASHIRVFAADHGVLSTLSNTGVSVDLCLNESLDEDLVTSQSLVFSWLKTHVVPYLPHVNIKSITVNGRKNLSNLLSTLNLIHSVLRSFHLDNEVKVSVAFSFSFLENLNRTRGSELHRILGFIKRSRSFVIVEASIDLDVEMGMGDLLAQSMIQKVSPVASLLPCSDVPLVMTVKSLLVPSAIEVVEFTDMVSKSLENIQIAGQVAEFYAELPSMKDLVEKELKRENEQIFPSSRREIMSVFKTTLHDTTNTPVTVPPENPTPIITVPATNPVTITPGNPATTPVPIPSTTPVTVPATNSSVTPPPVPITNPVTTPAPITNPVTTPAPITVPGAQPITNPVTTYPPPAGTVPVPNPVTPPATTNAPSIPGQSWCVAKTGALQSALQSALDYACGMGGADCAAIQQGASCYNPDTLQNHASYAFNGYYQKNPAPTSCDFGGTANIVNTNPSTGSCIYPSSSSSSLPTPSTSAANPVTASSPPGSGASGTGTTPVLNSSNPTSGSTTVFGSDAPPGASTSTSKSATFQPFISCIILVVFFVTRKIVLDM